MPPLRFTPPTPKYNKQEKLFPNDCIQYSQQLKARKSP